MLNFSLLGNSMIEIKKNYKLTRVDMICQLTGQILKREDQSANFFNEVYIHEANERDVHWCMPEDAQI